MPASSRDHYNGMLYRHPVGQAIGGPQAANPIVGTAQEQPAPVAVLAAAGSGCVMNAVLLLL